MLCKEVYTENIFLSELKHALVCQQAKESQIYVQVNASSMCHVEQQGGGYSRQWQSIYAPPGGSSRTPPKCRDRSGCPYFQFHIVTLSQGQIGVPSMQWE